MGTLTTRVGRRAHQLLSRLQRRLARYLETQEGVIKDSDVTLGAAYEAGWEGYDCVFVLSTGRTGTQTLSALLGCSPFIVAEHEPAPRLVQASYDAFLDQGQAQWLDRWTPFVLAARDDHVLLAKRRGRIYVETNNRMSMLSPALRAAFPASRFIFLHRDPYKVIVSSMRRGAYQGPNRAWNFARIHPPSGDPYAAQWEQMSPVEKEAWRWARVNADIMNFMTSLPKEGRLELPSTDLFSKERSVYERLFGYMRVPLPPRQELLNVLDQRLNAGARFNGSGYTLTGQDQEKIRPIIAEVAERLGYEV